MSYTAWLDSEAVGPGERLTLPAQLTFQSSSPVCPSLLGFLSCHHGGRFQEHCHQGPTSRECDLASCLPACSPWHLTQVRAVASSW